MNNLELAKSIIKEHYNEGTCGIFNTSSLMNDPMITLYRDNQLTINICFYYEYFEVFGLSKEDFEELVKYYNSLEEK